MWRKHRELFNRLNIYSILFVISPVFVVGVVIHAYIFAILFFIIVSVFIVLVKKPSYYLLIPLLLLASFYIVLHIIIPAISWLYFALLSHIGFIGTILSIGAIAVAIFILISTSPDLYVAKKPIRISVLLPLWLGAIALIFILLPIVTMVCGESIYSIANAFNDPLVRDSILLSVETAFYSTCIAVVLGIPIAYLLARKEFFGKTFIKSIVDLPVVIPHTVAGIALLTVFSAHGIIGEPLQTANVKFVDALPGIVVAMLFVSMPFVINSAQDGFAAVDKRLENVARNLGASRLKTFITITLPLAARNIFTGSVMAWARAISEFGAVMILAYYPKIAPILIYDRFVEGGLNAARPVAVLLILICLVVFIAVRYSTVYKMKKDKG